MGLEKFDYCDCDLCNALHEKKHDIEMLEQMIKPENCFYYFEGQCNRYQSKRPGKHLKCLTLNKCKACPKWGDRWANVLKLQEAKETYRQQMKEHGTQESEINEMPKM